MGKEVNGAARVQLTSAGNVQPCWQDVGGILVAVGAIGVSGRIVIVDREGNFAAAVGVQTFANDIEVAATPLQPGTNLAGSGLTGLGMKTAGKNFFSFDPTVGGAVGTSNGDITKFFRFRIGILYITQTTNTVSRGEVLLEYTVRYA